MTGGQQPVRRPVAVLTGFMGAGKSTVGRVVADRLGVDFVDVDDEIVHRTGQSIPEIFADAGPSGFRQLEAEVVADILEHHRGVVALGGGAVTTEAVRDALRGHRVVHLKVDADAGFARVAGTDRPLLAGADPAERYRVLLAERSSIYAEVATIEVDAAHGDAHDVADTIIAAIARELVPERTP